MEKPTVTEGYVPVVELIILGCFLNYTLVHTLKDDGCNTNVVSKTFLTKYRYLFRVKDTRTVLSPYKVDTTEEASEVVLEAELLLGDTLYRSNCVVADYRYEVLLGMTW